MKNFLTPESKCKTFNKKSKKLQKLINQALDIIHSMGIPLDEKKPRGLEKMALVFISVAQISKSRSWNKAKDRGHGISLKSRDIIVYMNEHLEENISSGSYDDIRRKDLKMMVLDGLISNTNPNAARNDPTRGYCLSPEYGKAIRSYGSDEWSENVKKLLAGKKTLKEVLSQKRNLERVDVKLPSGTELKFSPGKHNELQKEIIENFLPLFGSGAEVLYVGDTSDKFLHINRPALEALAFFELKRGELPDVVAYNKNRNWLFLIEAVHSSGPVSPTRLLELEKLTQKCTADRIYVTAFLDKATFRKFVADIAWETEVWIADRPEHMIHFNGDKFLGPYDNTKFQKK